MACQRLQRQQGVGHPDHAAARQRLRRSPVHHHGRGAQAGSLGHVVVRVELFAGERDKQIAGPDFARVGADVAGELGAVARDEFAAAVFGDRPEREGLHQNSSFRRLR